ncbi:MAG: 50S ribosomal protein L17 [Planctomycetota bacterium]|jgi:large subunit ribosomal protein L17|nr:50S ribosomal protein L17 [Planctomycetota bacterium]
MRHLKSGRKLNRNSSHRHAMARNMVAGLFQHGKIITTPAKAKEVRPFAERLITLAKRGKDDLAARRRAIQLLHNRAVVKLLFDDISLRYLERQGGYTRILHIAKTRVGDGARQVLFELVEGGKPVPREKSKNRNRVEPARVVKSEPLADKTPEAPVVDEPVATPPPELEEKKEGEDQA